MEKPADHRTDGQGHARRSRKMSCGGRQRLHSQAVGRGEALVAGARVDAEVDSAPPAGREFDVEMALLIDAMYRLYHYDFRGYAPASLRRRLKAAALRFECKSLSQLQDRVIHDPAMFPALLDFLTVQVSEMFRDPGYF